jgi:hypothetical protein
MNKKSIAKTIVIFWSIILSAIVLLTFGMMFVENPLAGVIIISILLAVVSFSWAVDKL